MRSRSTNRPAALALGDCMVPRGLSLDADERSARVPSVCAYPIVSRSVMIFDDLQAHDWAASERRQLPLRLARLHINQRIVTWACDGAERRSRY